MTWALESSAKRKPKGERNAHGSHDLTPFVRKLRQDDAEAVAELGQIRKVDHAVPVEVEERPVIRVTGCRTEGVAERRQIRDVHRPVAVEVAEEAVQVWVGTSPQSRRAAEAQRRTADGV